MGRISEEDVIRVRDATDIVAVISETVPLRQKGRLFWGNCPFHQEKTPSFKVDPATQLWHCFGCGLGGDAFGFVMRAERMEFPDAVRRLADRARIEIVEEKGGAPTGQRERLTAANEAAVEFWTRQLATSKEAGAAAADTPPARAARSPRSLPSRGSRATSSWRATSRSSRRAAAARVRSRTASSTASCSRSSTSTAARSRSAGG
jgi:hypothetical protein